MHQPWLARWLGHWASFNWTVFSLFGLTLAVPFLLPESCRWLIANDKKDKVQGASDKELHLHSTHVDPWKNGNRHPGWGVAEIQKMSPPTTGRHAAAVLSNKGVPQFWEM